MSRVTDFGIASIFTRFGGVYIPAGVYFLGLPMWICIYSPWALVVYILGVDTGAVFCGDVRSRDADFGYGFVFSRSGGGLHSGCMHCGGQLSRVTDFGSGFVTTRSRGLHSLRSTLWRNRFRIWNCKYFSLRSSIANPSRQVRVENSWLS